jgi:alkanesulfonate monooxygenase SsuD/methylene tetrahydromethanopterin reductase-like flavin-dependent oxidoreductase (luciferase family)
MKSTSRLSIGGGYRVDTENFIVGLADRGVRSSVLRLPPVVHSSLAHFQVSEMTCLPPPVQQPRIPIWIGTRRSSPAAPKAVTNPCCRSR